MPQVVDLEWELQRRGFTALQAAQLLDAGLSLRLTVYIGCRWVDSHETLLHMGSELEQTPKLLGAAYNSSEGDQGLRCLFSLLHVHGAV